MKRSPGQRVAVPLVPSARPAGLAGWAGLGYLVAVAYASLLPFEFRSIGSAGSSPVHLAWRLLTSPTWSIGPVDDLVLNALVYLPFGWLVAWPARSARRRRLCVVGAVVAFAAALAWGIESLQSLMPMRCASLTDWTLNTAGALIGASAAVWGPGFGGRLHRSACRAGEHLLRCWRRLPRRPAQVVIGGALVIQVAWYWRSAMPQADRLADPALARLNLMPLLLQFRMAYGSAVAALAEQAMGFAFMAGLLCLALRLVRPAWPRWTAIALVGAVATAAELLKWLDRARYPDVTDPLLACLAAAGVVFGLRVLRQLARQRLAGAV